MKNMKTILTFALFALVSFFTVDSLKALPNEMGSANKLIAFKEMEKGHKADWFNYAQKVHDDKFSLLRKQHKEIADMHIAGIRKFEKLTDCSPEAKEAILKQKLEDAVALHQKQTAEWKSMCQKHIKEAEKLAADHKKDLNSFIKENLKGKGLEAEEEKEDVEKEAPKALKKAMMPEMIAAPENMPNEL